MSDFRAGLYHRQHGCVTPNYEQKMLIIPASPSAVQRGKDRILPYQEYLIETFADVADSFVLWFADPGACICSECRDYLRVMLDALHTLSIVIDSRAAITTCPWWIENIEAGKSGFASHPNLRRRIASEFPEGSKVIIRSVEYETIEIMREAGLVPLPLAFFLDPRGRFRIE